MARFQILSLIGGGIRGGYITALLSELEKQLGRPIFECFDLIAGSSTGGIIAAGLACGKSAQQMQQFYEEYGEGIFSPRPKYRAKGVLRAFYAGANWAYRRRTGNMLDAFLRARYCPDALHRSFELGFGEMTLNDVNGSRLIVPAVNLTQGRPHIFRSCHIPESLADRDVRIMDMLVAATAAPTYFPHKEINGQAYADGGLWTVDPSMLSFAEGMRIRRDCQRGQCDPSFNMEDIALLSIGTGNASYSLCPPGSDAGMLYWAQHVADLMTTVQVAGVHEPLKFLLGDNFHHLNFDMNQKWPLDGIENLPRLFDLGKQHARDAYSTLTERFLGHSRKPFVPYGVEDLTGNAS